jgi:hypothetical protein
MRRALVVALASCSFRTNSASTDAADTASLIDDTAADFIADATLVDGVIDPSGAIVPEAFVVGGFHARSYLGNLVKNQASWTGLETAAAAAGLRGEAYAQLPADWTTSHPRGLSLNTDDNFTVLYDGELAVPAGDHTVSVDVDDNALVQIGTLVATAQVSVATLAIHFDTAGWIPVRMAVGETGGNARLVVKLDGNAITPAQTRAPVSDAHGLLTWIYYSTSPTAYAVAGPVVTMPSVDWGMGAPPFDLTGPTNAYTARMLGEVHVDQDGTYLVATATTSTDDSSALYLDRHLVSRMSSIPYGHPSSAMVPLTAGWHSLAIELVGSQKNISGAADAHDVALTTTLPAGTLRPAAREGYLGVATSASVKLNDTTTNGGVTDVPLGTPTPAPAVGATIESASVAYTLHDAEPSDYTTVILDEAGTPMPMPATGMSVSALGDETSAGKPVPTAATPWRFTFTDTVPGNATGKTDQSVLAYADYTYHGGPQRPFAQQVTYISSARELTDITAFGMLQLTVALDGATAIVSIRTAATADTLATAAWIDVPDGTVPTAAPLPFVQYRIVLMSDGWSYPSVDKIELDYVRS